MDFDITTFLIIMGAAIMLAMFLCAISSPPGSWISGLSGRELAAVVILREFVQEAQKAGRRTSSPDIQTETTKTLPLCEMVSNDSTDSPTACLLKKAMDRPAMEMRQDAAPSAPVFHAGTALNSYGIATGRSKCVVSSV